MINKIVGLMGRILLSAKRFFFPDIYARLEQVEYRSFNRRFYAVEQICEYLLGAQIPGDYAEFGVFQGTTFMHAYKNMSNYFKDMKFIAFDSFEGLPAPKGIDAVNGYSSSFYPGQFMFSEKEFLDRLKRNKVDLKRVKTVKGWFDKTLSRDMAKSYGIDKLAAVWIDCDLYESTVPVLDFITPYLSVGSVIFFDDWRCFRNHPEYGQQKACKEWLAANPKIKLSELLSFGWNGIVFTVVTL